MVFSFCCVVIALSVAVAKSSTPSGVAGSLSPPVEPQWPSPLPDFGSSWFGGSLTGFEWQDPTALEALRKYKTVLTGWMELLAVTNFTNATAIAVEQAIQLKAALGENTAVFSYQSAYLGAAFYPEVRFLVDNIDMYRDFFLVGEDGNIMNDTTYCIQTKTPPFDGCLSYFWNFCNTSAVDYYIDKVLRPLVQFPNGTAMPYDGVFLDNSDSFSTHGASNAKARLFLYFK